MKLHPGRRSNAGLPVQAASQLPSLRTSVAEARERVRQGARLVCAYEDPARCASLGLEEAWSLQELEARASSQDDIIFACG